MRRPVVSIVWAVLLLTLLTGCRLGPRPHEGSLSQYVTEVRPLLAELVDWADAVLALSREAVSTHNADVLCRDGKLAEMVEEGQDIVDRLADVAAPTALEPLHDGAVIAAKAALEKLADACDLLCERAEMDRGLDLVEDAIAPIEDLLDRLRQLQKALPNQ